ncbi:hypothetical protein ES703_38266 [subsurface metagenome]
MLRAEMDGIIAIFNCPQEPTLVNAYRPAKLRVMAYELKPVPFKDLND